jgi:hypothetical protein
MYSCDRLFAIESVGFYEVKGSTELTGTHIHLIWNKGAKLLYVPYGSQGDADDPQDDNQGDDQPCE